MNGRTGPRWAKWSRAREHIETLQAKHAEVTGSPHGYPVTAQPYREGLEYRFFLGTVEPIDTERWALVVGDALFSLRSALDHIVYELHSQLYNGNIPRDAAQQSEFPIFDSPPRPPVLERRAICRLPDRQKAAIEALQPYNRVNDSEAWIRRYLWNLQDLNRIDKHRRLNVVRQTNTGSPLPIFDDKFGFDPTTFWDRFKSDTEVMRWTFKSVPPNIAEEVKMNSYVIADVVFGERAYWGLSVQKMLIAISNAVEAVVKKFLLLPP